MLDFSCKIEILVSLLMTLVYFKEWQISLLFSRLLNKNVSKQVNLDIEISDFFVLNDFQPEGIDGKNLQLEFENHKVLMAGMVGREILTKCDNGGLYL